MPATKKAKAQKFPRVRTKWGEKFELHPRDFVEIGPDGIYNRATKVELRRVLTAVKKSAQDPQAGDVFVTRINTGYGDDRAVIDSFAVYYYSGYDISIGCKYFTKATVKRLMEYVGL